MEEVREYRTRIRKDSLAGFAEAVDEMRRLDVPLIADVTVERSSLAAYRELVARYRPEPCYVADCDLPAVREDQDALVCRVHTAADLTDEDDGIEGVLDALVSGGLIKRIEA